MIRDIHIADTMKNALRGTEKLELVAEDINFWNGVLKKIA